MQEKKSIQRQDDVQRMKDFIKERYGITTQAQLMSRLKEMQKINLAIFTEVIAIDNR